MTRNISLISQNYTVSTKKDKHNTRKYGSEEKLVKIGKENVLIGKGKKRLMSKGSSSKLTLYGLPPLTFRAISDFQFHAPSGHKSTRYVFFPNLLNYPFPREFF